MWHGFGDAERYRAKAETLAGHCADAGRDPADITHVWGIPEGRIDAAEELVAAGATVLTVSVGGGDDADYDLTTVKAVLDWAGRRR